MDVQLAWSLRAATWGLQCYRLVQEGRDILLFVSVSSRQHQHIILQWLWQKCWKCQPEIPNTSTFLYAHKAVQLTIKILVTQLTLMESA